MVTKDGLVKILDFGLAKLAHPERTRSDRVGDDGLGRHAAGDRDGDRRLHVAGAGERPSGGLPIGPVRVRLDALRDGDGPAGVQAADDGADAGGDHRRGAGADAGGRARRRRRRCAGSWSGAWPRSRRTATPRRETSCATSPTCATTSRSSRARLGRRDRGAAAAAAVARDRGWRRPSSRRSPGCSSSAAASSAPACPSRATGSSRFAARASVRRDSRRTARRSSSRRRRRAGPRSSSRCGSTARRRVRSGCRRRTFSPSPDRARWRSCCCALRAVPRIGHMAFEQTSAPRPVAPRRDPGRGVARRAARRASSSRTSRSRTGPRRRRPRRRPPGREPPPRRVSDREDDLRREVDLLNHPRVRRRAAARRSRTGATSTGRCRSASREAGPDRQEASKSPGPIATERSGTPIVDTATDRAPRDQRRRAVIASSRLLPGDFVLYDMSRGRRSWAALVKPRRSSGASRTSRASETCPTSIGPSPRTSRRTASGSSFATPSAPPTPADPARLSPARPTAPNRNRCVEARSRLAPDGRFVLGESPWRMRTTCDRVAGRADRSGAADRSRTWARSLDWIEGHVRRSFRTARGFSFRGRRGLEPESRVWVQDLAGGPPRPITPEDTRRPVLVGDGRFVCAPEPPTSSGTCIPTERRAARPKGRGHPARRGAAAVVVSRRARCTSAAPMSCGRARR